ncbi:FAD-dependent monooxygenase (plasmid) [Rhodococcus sp. USK10]|uniref:FAD-dependent monooxygenase n=1 Tax=Rhodococcus sp. USK10 TaxID=2789739 RepID=UPI001C5F1AB9|nr:FAD-dependent monooxygenase [Rhodococcus sp. USK10]QYB00171.1 FAD-dependent monooxygenase [Rhodococcus sp. USK10]
MTDNLSVAVCGAGLGGLTAALALQQRGVDVTLYEQTRQLSEVGAGLQLSANAIRVLDSLGLFDALDRVASRPAGKRVRLWDSGKTWPLFDLGGESQERFGFPYLMIHRADLHDTLRSEFERRAPGRLRLGHRLESFRQDNDTVTMNFADGSTAVHDAMVGADGVHSVVRSGLFGPSDPKFSGCVAWRGVVPAAGLRDELRVPYGTNWIGPHGHVIQYPLRGGELINFVGIVERDDWSVESWNIGGTTEELTNDFDGWHPDVRSLIRAIDTPMKWALNLRSTMPSWSQGRVTLLGDACHPTLPFLAQGACMAIEDGVVLARAIDAHDRLEDAHAAYEEARIERTTAVVTGSADNADRFHNPLLADPARAEEYVSEQWASTRVSGRYDWLFEYDALSVPI